jgi:hypothetical protein
MNNIFGAVNTGAGINANSQLLKSYGLPNNGTDSQPKTGGSVQSLLNQVATMNSETPVNPPEMSPEAAEFFKMIGGGSKDPMMFDFNLSGGINPQPTTQTPQFNMGSYAPSSKPQFFEFNQ